MQAISRIHDPISDRLNRLMAQSGENFQRFISRAESSGQWAALTKADHEFMLSDMLAWEDATSLVTAPKVIKAYKAKTKQRDMSLRAESAWACLTVASPTIADAS